MVDQMDSKKEIENRIKKYKHLPTNEMDLLIKNEILSVLIDIRDLLVDENEE